MTSVLYRFRAVVLGVLVAVCTSAPALASDPNQPAAELRTDAETGNAWAMHDLGHAYLTGRDMPKDTAEAIVWFTKATGTDNSVVRGLSSLRMARMYLEGNGVPADETRAFIHMRNAADDGEYAAFLPLAEMYENARGTARDTVAARYWYIMASSQGVEAGAQALERLNLSELGPLPPPPEITLHDGEYLTLTTQGCHVIHYLPPGAPEEVHQTVRSTSPETRERGSWTGSCTYGLANGKGKWNGKDAEFYYGQNTHGHTTDVYMTQWRREKNIGVTIGHPHDYVLALTNLVPDEKLWTTVIWPRAPFGSDPYLPSTLLLSLRGKAVVWIGAGTKSCDASDRRAMTTEQRVIMQGRTCGRTGGDIIYVVEKRVMSESADPVVSYAYCPNPLSDQGCESVWRTVLAAYDSQLKHVRSLGDNMAQRRYVRKQVYENYELSLKQHHEAGLALNTAAQERIRPEVTARLKTAAEQRQAAADQAAKEAKEKEDKAFLDSLKGLNPGQMLARADELEQEGRRSEARIVLRELLSRHPDHPLAQHAAQRLSQ